jgi:hypothetical protein
LDRLTVCFCAGDELTGVYALLRGVMFAMDGNMAGLLRMTPDVVPYARAWTLANLLDGLRRGAHE